MGELISRAEAKEALRERFKRIPTYAIWAMHIIDELPTHQTPSNTLGALDCIDRKEAIKAILGEPPEVNYPIYYAEKIRELPSVQPRKGEWIYGESEIGNDGYYCSVCGNFVPWKYDEYDIDFIKEFLFCPQCGVDMRGEEDGNT